LHTNIHAIQINFCLNKFYRSICQKLFSKIINSSNCKFYVKTSYKKIRRLNYRIISLFLLRANLRPSLRNAQLQKSTSQTNASLANRVHKCVQTSCRLHTSRRAAVNLSISRIGDASSKTKEGRSLRSLIRSSANTRIFFSNVSSLFS